MCARSIIDNVEMKNKNKGVWQEKALRIILYYGKDIVKQP